MPRGAWTAKRERQYAHIKSACLKKAEEAVARGAKNCEPCSFMREQRCKRIAAATVNKARCAAGEATKCRARAR